MSFLSQPLQTIFIRPKRAVGPIKVQVVVNEQSIDTLTITKQPVQQGASITDHAYLEPVSFSHTIYFAAPGLEALVGSFIGGSGESLAQIYQKLLDLQSGAIPFDIVTPKRVYKNMLMATLTMTTDKQTENCLSIHASYQQIIMVPVSTAVVPRIAQRNPGSTQATQNTGNKSAALTLIQGIKNFFGGG